MDATCGLDGLSCAASTAALSDAARAAILVLKSLSSAERCGVLQEVLGNGTSTVEPDAPSEDSEDESFIGPMITMLFICFATSVIARLIHVVIKEYHRYHDRHADKHAPFKTYLRYRFGYWYTWTPGSSGIVLLTLSLILLLVGGTLLRLCVDQPISESLWSAWIWIAAPDGGGSQETPLGRMVGCFVSIGGMLIFALLMSVVSSMFEEMLHGLRAGAAPVVEGDHCVIIGDGPMLGTIVSELCHAAESRGGRVIAILSTEPKPDVEEFLRESEIDFRNSTVVVRSGHGHKMEDLERVSVDSAKKVIVLGKPNVSREDCDAMTLNVLLTLKNNGWPRDGSCVVQCELVRNQRLFRQLAGENSQVLSTGDFVGELMVQCSRQRGLASVVSQVFSFDGDEFYIRSVGGAAGRPFHEAIFMAPNVVVIGLASKERGVELLPMMDRVIGEDEELVMLAEDASTLPGALAKGLLENSEGAKFQARWHSEHTSPKSRSLWKTRKVSDFEVVSAGVDVVSSETVVVLGWNEGIGAILVELDKSVGRRSSVVIHSPLDATFREVFLEKAQRRRCHQFQNITVTHSVGPLGARFQLEELPLEKAARILVLTDSGAADFVEADGQTVAAIVQIQDILSDKIGQSEAKGKVLIMPQVNESSTEDACAQTGILDKVNCPLLAGRIISLVAEAPQVKGIVDGIVKDKGCQFNIRALDEYPAAKDFDRSEGINFDAVSALAMLSGEICVGWTVLSESLSGPWEINPKDRVTKRPWGSEDRLVVLRRTS
eukprot:TRINITY_DN28603_c0_g4_i1.p1 TRINITY_DN28603_c0_g4~~TRINITY_DN28603_c0_g4_i1.p1  ORF type:complete len:797 (+),score=137.50 TRINITY_DN28603_c0_g4_i1:72-2393(+)